MRLTHDVAILGAGFAGALLARLLQLRGRSVVLLEKERHPRTALGESTTPLAGLALERLAARFDLPDLHCLSSWRRLRRGAPHLRCGLKRGFTFYHHARGEPFQNSAAGENRLLVAASPDDALADSQWLRADVDHEFVRRAVAQGVDYRDRTTVRGVEVESSGVRLSTDAGEIRADFVVDAAGALTRLLDLPSHPDGLRISSSLLGGHFTGVAGFVDAARRAGAAMPPGPYPDEKAAVHHLLDEGWMYVLPFDHGVVSAGLVLEDLPSGDSARCWDDLLAAYPNLAATFAAARPERWLRREGLQYRTAHAVGERWALLPHSHAFVGPMFSTGITWSLLGVERMVDVLTGDADLDRYDELLALEVEQIDRLLAAAWAARHDSRLFEAVAHLYFATVSFREIRQRLELDADPPAWRGFLDADDADHRSLFEETLQRVSAMPRTPPTSEADAFVDWIVREIAPRNIAGLADPSRKRLYGVDLDVLLDRSDLLDLSRAELTELLPRLLGD